MSDTTPLGLFCLGSFIIGLLAYGIYLMTRTKIPVPPAVSNNTPNNAIISESILMEAIGVGGKLQLLENKIRIIRRGFMAFSTHGLSGDKEIFIRQISSIQLKMPNFLTNGYIQFAFIGGQETKGGIFDAAHDENTIMFSADQTQAFLAIKQAIEGKVTANPISQSHPTSASDEIEKLAALRDKGIITDDEFQGKKKQLLGL